MKKTGFFSARNAVLLFIVFMALYVLINSKPYGLAKLTEITGGASILDMEMSGYSVDRAYEVLEALGEEGRAFQLKYIVPLDIPFPLAYAMFYFVTLTVIGTALFKNIKRPWLLGIIGLAAGAFDLLENIMIVILLRNYPEKLPGVARIASLFTVLKSSFTVISMLLIVSGLIAIVVRKFLQGRKR